MKPATADIARGDRIRITTVWRGGTTAVYEGKVAEVRGMPHCLGMEGCGTIPLVGPTLTDAEITMLEAAPMEEPPPGTIVRHAGQRFARPVGLSGSDMSRWVAIDRTLTENYISWRTWPQVLALSRAERPEIVP